MKKTENMKEHKTESWQNATVKGALIWGTVYWTVFTGFTLLVAPLLADGSKTLAELAKSAALVFPLAGVLRGIIMWHIQNGFRPLKTGRKRESNGSFFLWKAPVR